MASATIEYFVARFTATEEETVDPYEPAETVEEATEEEEGGSE